MDSMLFPSWPGLEIYSPMKQVAQPGLIIMAASASVKMELMGGLSAFKDIRK